MDNIKMPKKPILVYYLVIFFIIFVANAFIKPMILENKIEEMDYSTFITMTEQQEIDKVEIQQSQERILFTKKGSGKIYKTAIMNDNMLVERLHKAGTDFTAEINEPMNPILRILTSWVLPIFIFIMIGQWMNRRMMQNQMGGGSMQFGLGKSNAKVYT